MREEHSPDLQGPVGGQLRALSHKHQSPAQLEGGKAAPRGPPACLPHPSCQPQPARNSNSGSHGPFPSASADRASSQHHGANCRARPGYVSGVPTVQGPPEDQDVARSRPTDLSTYAVAHSLCEALAPEKSTQGSTCHHDPHNSNRTPPPNPPKPRQSVTLLADICVPTRVWFQLWSFTVPESGGGPPSSTRRPRRTRPQEGGVVYPAPQSAEGLGSSMAPAVLRI